MLKDKFYEVLEHEGVVSIVSWGAEEPHVTCTWNSYLIVKEDSKILIPAAGMTSTEKDVNENNKVKITLGARDVMGKNDYQETGFEIHGSEKFLTSGPEFDQMKESLLSSLKLLKFQ